VAARVWLSARWAGYAAAAVAVAYAGVSLYWAFGGQALLSTVGGWPEQAARRGGATAVLLGVLVAGAKLAGAVLALAVAHRVGGPVARRRLVRLAAATSTLLVLYGGVLVVAGALVLAGVIDPGGAVDRTALRWHVLVWDAWFLLWGLLLGLAVLHHRQTHNKSHGP